MNLKDACLCLLKLEWIKWWTREKLKEAFWVLKLEWSKLRMKKRNKLKEACFEARMKEIKKKGLSALKIEWSKWIAQSKGSLFKSIEAIMKEIEKE